MSYVHQNLLIRLLNEHKEAAPVHAIAKAILKFI